MRLTCVIVDPVSFPGQTITGINRISLGIRSPSVYNRSNIKVDGLVLQQSNQYQNIFLTSVYDKTRFTNIWTYESRELTNFPPPVKIVDVTAFGNNASFYLCLKSGDGAIYISSSFKTPEKNILCILFKISDWLSSKRPGFSPYATLVRSLTSTGEMVGWNVGFSPGTLVSTHSLTEKLQSVLTREIFACYIISISIVLK